MSGRPALIATCSRGLEPLLEAELRLLGMPRVRPLRGAVLFGATLEDGYRALLWSRLASRILLELDRFRCPDADRLYEGIRGIPWTDHLAPSGALAVDFVGGSHSIRHNQFGARRVKDAIVDQIRDRHGVRPDVDLERPDVRINVHLDGRHATVCIDLAGRPLHERGFRRHALVAPLKENLAAALLAIAGWTGKVAASTALVDPMCGSGTFLVEAAMIGADMAPGLARGRWGFSHWRGHHRELWADLVDDARARAHAGLARPLAIYGADVDGEAVATARRNVQEAGLADHIRLARRPVARAVPPPGDAGILITNPPYGERLDDTAGADAVVRALGDALRRRFLGWKAFVLVGSTRQAKALGLRPSRRHEVRNGPLDARLLEVPIAERPPDGDGPAWR
ncbi:MAG: THUMP domain-containing protein [Myxococcota bacterium]|nr:THUMP domain-containing protein [Myxococcota bacterium]